MPSESQEVDDRAFQWNAGAWFGSLLGASSYLVLGTVMFLPSNARVGAVWGVCAIAMISFGLWLWGRRARISAYAAIQALLASGFVIAAVALGVLAVEAPALAGPGFEGRPARLLLVLLIFPYLMLQFAVMKRWRQ